MSASIWVTWAFAAWWLFVAFRDYNGPASPRRGNKTSLYLALVAAGQLAFIGYALLQSLTPIIFVVALAFALTWILWSAQSLESKRQRATETKIIKSESEEGIDSTEKLIETLKDKSVLWLIRQNALEKLGALRDERAVGPILEVFDDEQISDIEKIIALIKLDGTTAIEALIQQLTQSDIVKRVMVVSIRRLANEGDKRDVETLRSLQNGVLQTDRISEKVKDELSDEIIKTIEKLDSLPLECWASMM